MLHPVREAAVREALEAIEREGGTASVAGDAFEEGAVPRGDGRARVEIEARVGREQVRYRRSRFPRPRRDDVRPPRAGPAAAPQAGLRQAGVTEFLPCRTGSRRDQVLARPLIRRAGIPRMERRPATPSLPTY